MSEREGGQADRLRDAAPTMQAALEFVLCWMTNVNFAEPWEVAAKVMTALTASGYDEDALDDAAVAMMKGAASIGPRPPDAIAAAEKGGEG